MKNSDDNSGDRRRKPLMAALALLLTGFVFGISSGLGFAHWLPSFNKNTNAPQLQLPYEDQSTDPLQYCETNPSTQLSRPAPAAPTPAVDRDKGFDLSLILPISESSAPAQKAEALSMIQRAEIQMVADATQESGTQLATSGTGQWAFARLLEHWYAVDSESALDYLTTLMTQSRMQNSAGILLYQAIETLVDIDADRLLLWVEEQPEGYIKSDLYQMTLSMLAQSDPMRALDLAAGTSDPYMEVSILMGWAQQEPAMALDWLSGHGTEEQRQAVIPMIFHSWIEQDAEAGLVASMDVARTAQEKLEARLAYSQVLAMQDPVSALEWANELSQTEHQDQLYQSILQTWSQINPDSLLSHIKSISDPEELDRVLKFAGNFSGMFADQHNQQELIAYFNALGTESSDALVAGQFNQWLHQSPTDALDWLLGHDLTRQAELLDYSAGAIPAIDLDLAMRTFREGTTLTRHEMVFPMVSELYQRDPAQAMQWIEQLDEKQVRDQADIALIHHLSQHAPLEALEYATGNHDPVQRLLLLQQSLTMVPAGYSRQIEQWLTTVDLTDLERKQLKRSMSMSLQYAYEH